MKNQIFNLHICGLDKFMGPYYRFIQKNFTPEEHKFLTRSVKGKDFYPAKTHWEFCSGIEWLISFLSKAYSAKKIFLHSLFEPGLLILLAFQPWLLRKTYWLIWGGDLYLHNKPRKSLLEVCHELFRRIVIARMGHLVTYVRGDADYARMWYGAKGKLHHCFLYLSNILSDNCLNQERSKPGEPIRILIGNSADPSNRHSEILEKLESFKNENILIFAPLSYGSKIYAELVSKLGKTKFGNKFIPLTELMMFDQYKKFLATIDIAIFNHDRQQGMGNLIPLLGMGKKVFINEKITTWNFLKEIGIKCFSNSCLDLSPLSNTDMNKNISLVKAIFSEATLYQQWNLIFKGN